MLLNGQIATTNTKASRCCSTSGRGWWPISAYRIGDAAAQSRHAHGRTPIPEAFLEMYFFERACATQIATLAGGTPLHWPADSVQAVVQQQAKYGTSQVAQLAWAGLLRMLDRNDPSYKF